MLRYGVPEAKLPRAVLDAETGIVEKLGGVCRMKTIVGKDVSVDELRREFDALFIAAGTLKAERIARLGLQAISGVGGLSVNSRTLQTPTEGIFAGGSSARTTKLAVRSAADGYLAARSIDQLFSDGAARGARREWSCHIGKLVDGEMEAFLQGASPSGRVDPAGGAGPGFSEEEGRREAARCLHCDCRKPASCKLRRYAAAYEAEARRYAGLAPSDGPPRKTFRQEMTHRDIVYEPGKCIDCGICVKIAEESREALGLTFIGRGFNVKVGVPFGGSVAEGLRQVAIRCAEACPTGALART
jgi:ferredoxin